MNQPKKYVGDVRTLSNVMVPMRDGVKLATSVCLPKAAGRYPVVLVRTAYNRVGVMSHAPVLRGMAVVTQDVRGRYGSDGDFYPFTSEEQDGLDTLDWLVKQEWCNGKVAMYGDSYLAATQFCLAAPGHPALVSLNPRFMSGDMWRQAYYVDGVFSVALTFSWLVLEVGSRTSEAAMLPWYNVPEMLKHLPTRTLDEAYGRNVQYYRDYVDHYSRDQFWQDLSWRETLGKTRVPMLLTAGWYDYYSNETFRNYEALMKGDAPDEIKRKHRVLVGPWTHGMNGHTHLGELDFGHESLRENDSTHLWLEKTLLEGNIEEVFPAPIRIFVMGANKWRDEQEWPLARTKYTKMYLRSGGKANGLHGDGVLSASPGGPGECVDGYTYDPENPVPTLGGNHSVGPYNPGLYEHALPGPLDQRPNERREDVLVYTTSPLEAEMELTGPVTVFLYAATSGPDTDFVARLTDVYPDGRSMNITEGVIRGRFQERIWDKPRLLEPEKVYLFEIQLQPTSNVFKKGHAIRLDITSSNFPLWDRNLNTGEPVGAGTRIAVARQRVLHDAAHPSHVVLPVIPR